MLRVLLALGCLVSSAAAQLPGDNGVAVYNGDMQTPIESSTKVFNFQSGDFACTTQATGEVLCELGANASEFGSCVSDTEFCDPTQMPYVVIGGSAVSSVLRLDPTSNATVTGGTIEMCESSASGSTPSFTGVSNCMTMLPDGLNLGSSSAIASGITMSPSVVQTTDALSAGLLPSYSGIVINPTYTVTDDAINGTNYGLFQGINMTPTIRNQSNDNYGGMVFQGIVVAPQWLKTGSGTVTVSTSESFVSLAEGTAASETVTSHTDFHARDISSAVNGTFTTHYGFLADAFTRGTNQLQFAAGEHTIASTVPAGIVEFGAKTAAPGRFYAKNENQQAWEMGYTTWTGVSATNPGTATAGTSLGANNTQHYFRINDIAAPSDTNTDVDIPAPGALTIFAMACAVNTAPANGGGTQTRTFTVREAGSSVAPSCAMSEASTTCTWCVASSGTPCTTTATTGEAVAAGALVDITNTNSGTPAATDATCTVYWTLDAF